MSTLDVFARLMRELDEDPAAEDWRTKWRHACELLWDTLSAEHTTAVSNALLDKFVARLSNRNMFSLARLVIPDLRQTSCSSDHPQLQRILDSTAELRESLIKQEKTTQRDFDDPLYTAEKRVLLDAELQRARVLLHQSGAFGAESEKAIEAWLKQHPDLLAGEEKAEDAQK